MAIRILQYRDGANRAVAMLDDSGAARRIDGVASTYDLAKAALAQGISLVDCAAAHAGEPIDLDALLAQGAMLPPIDHPDAAHCWLTGTGLTHLGSAEGRNQMHQAAAGAAVTDSMRMFQMGVEGGKPAPGATGVQPEWFYKGDGSHLLPTGAALPSPAFAEDGSEEPELAGIYIIDDEGRPRRLGYALANEFSDHVVERGNYLWLAHSKLRHAALGAELLTGDLPGDVRGTSRIVRDGSTVWEKPFLSGEDNMSHSIANLEHHHFKYALFRRPGDIHVHFFGTATLSFSDGFRAQDGDWFEIEAAPFRLPLRNPLTTSPAEPVEVLPL